MWYYLIIKNKCRKVDTNKGKLYFYINSVGREGYGIVGKSIGDKNHNFYGHIWEE